MLSTITIQGGEPPRIFSPCICHFVSSGIENCQPTFEEVPNAQVRASLESGYKL